MTKKHFMALADMIKTANEWRVRNSQFGLVVFDERAISCLAEFCQTQNPQFNREHWLDYIDGKCGKNGGKVKREVSK